MPQSSKALRAKKEARRLLREQKRASTLSPQPNHTLTWTESYALFEPMETKKVDYPIRWANKPRISHEGKCLALSLREEVVWVLVESQGQRRWKRVEQVLNKEERALWAKTGF